MTISRRDFLRLTAAAPVAAAAARSAAGPSAPASRPHRLLSTAADAGGGYRIAVLDPHGRASASQPLPARGHGTAVHPSGSEIAVIARRPGDFLNVLDPASGGWIAERRTPADRHLYGHGCYSRDGSLLYTSENALPSGEGRIGVWDARAGYRRIGELPAHGIGPHELVLAPDGERLIVANGGILTRPETGRAKLNLDTMRPALVYLDRHSGDLIEEHRLDESLHQCSIRHLAVGLDGVVCAAMQYQGPAFERPPLVAIQRPGRGLQPLLAPTEVQAALANYCGSAAADASGAWFAVSAPRGDLVTIWSNAGEYHARVRVADGCGVAPAERPGAFLLSSGHGGLYHYEISAGRLTELPPAAELGLQWDNHLRLVPAA